MAGYVGVFGYLYYETSLLQDGGFLLNNSYFVMTLEKSFLISASFLLSYDAGYTALGYADYFLIIQLFISQIIVLGFLFVILGDFIKRLEENNKLNKVKKSEKL